MLWFREAMTPQVWHQSPRSGICSGKGITKALHGRVAEVGCARVAESFQTGSVLSGRIHNDAAGLMPAVDHVSLVAVETR